MTKNPKRPRDPNHLAKAILDIATGEKENTKPVPKDPAAVSLGRKGGKARAEKLTAEERSAIARKGGSARSKDQS